MQNACLKNIYLFRTIFWRLKVNFFRQAFTNLMTTPALPIQANAAFHFLLND